jgi:hypothetical protein
MNNTLCGLSNIQKDSMDNDSYGEEAQEEEYQKGSVGSHHNSYQIKSQQ